MTANVDNYKNSGQSTTIQRCKRCKAYIQTMLEAGAQARKYSHKHFCKILMIFRVISPPPPPPHACQWSPHPERRIMAIAMEVNLSLHQSHTQLDTGRGRGVGHKRISSVDCTQHLQAKLDLVITC